MTNTTIPEREPGQDQSENESRDPQNVREEFACLGLSEDSVEEAVRAGFTRPTTIQKEVIPVVSSGRDVIGCSETGSGKTASFVLPLLDRIDYESGELQVLVLVPTRELCRQVADAFLELSRNRKLRVARIFGGASYTKQRKSIAEKPQVVVGAPGRVLDLAGGGDLDFRNVRVLILDEADRMLDMGFYPQMKRILKRVPQKRQTLMFSATIPAQVSRLASVCMNDPKNILVGERSRPPDQIRQEAVEVMPAEKDDKLIEIVGREKGSVLVFAATRAGTDGVYQVLKRAGQNVCVIHSGHPQGDRQNALDGFKSGKYRIMVATDVAQRGLDIEGISLVINYDLPDNTEDYIHRIGRTGRASAEGRALSLVTYHDYAALRNIEKAVGHTFQNFKRKNKTGLKRKVR